MSETELFKDEENCKDNSLSTKNISNCEYNLEKIKINNKNNNEVKNKKQITHDNEFFFNIFKTILQKYEYKNHNHNVKENVSLYTSDKKEEKNDEEKKMGI